MRFVTESIMWSMLVRCVMERESGSTVLSRSRRTYRRTQANWFPIALGIILLITIILIIPVFTETEIHIQIGYADNIMNVWVDTPSKPLISYLFPPSYPLGAYVVNVTVSIANLEIANFSRINVPIGEYVIIWQTGVPSHGFYNVTVQLFKLQEQKAIYTINVSF